MTLRARAPSIDSSPRRRPLRAWPCVLGAALVAREASADEGIAGVPVQLHGFASQGFLVSSDHNYLGPSERGSFEFTEVGLNVTVSPTDDLRGGMQLFARDLGPIGNYDAQFDWFYLDYRFADWLGLRAGRTKVPFGLYNEVNDVDAARVPVLLPQSVYPTQSRDFLLAVTGGELYGRAPLGDAGYVEYRLYGGTIFLDPTTAGGTTTVLEYDVPYLVGGRAMWETPLDGLRLGGSAQALRLDAELVLTADQIAELAQAGLLSPSFSGPIGVELPVVLWVASAEYVAGDLAVAAEYTRTRVELESTEPALLRATTTESEGLYAMASYHMASWFTPGVYYSLAFPDVNRRTGNSASQHDLAVTLRYDINDFWLAKLEGHYMHGTAVLDANLNEGISPAQLNPDWGLLLVKTTLYF